MYNLIISVVSLSITLFVLIFVFDSILVLYKLAKKKVMEITGFSKKQEVKKDKKFNTKCQDDISPACRKCAYRSECWSDLGILNDVIEVSENEGQSQEN